uniref:CRIB domain-containing protein n=1 Tax=Paramormyrops kingsleyae TaxID=1676925 RepID=A0A3B3Q8H5_9TELE
MTEFWVCFSCCIAEQPQPVSVPSGYTFLKNKKKRKLHSLKSSDVVSSVSDLQKRRRRIDRSMIGEPTNFIHTTHVGSGDMGLDFSVDSIQNQMKSKGGYNSRVVDGVQD